MPDRNENIPFARPYIGKEEEDAVLQVLRSGWLTTGQEALAFEKEFGDFLTKIPKEFPSETPSDQLQTPGSSPLYCFAVNSATSGLHLVLEACGVRQGDLVLLPSYTFTSTAEVIRYLGAEPVFVDVAPGTFNIDPDAIETTIKKIRNDKNRGTIKAVMPVHIGGLLCDMKPIMEIARKYEIRVIEDAAHSFPSLVSQKNSSGITEKCFAGTIGDAGVFSFYATKTITTGEGGMAVCRDKTIADRIAIMRSHGIDRSVWNRYTDTKASWYYEVVEAGYKYNLPDILAALGRVQLTRALAMLTMREEIAGRYNKAFEDDEHFILPLTGEGNAWHLYSLRIKPETLAINRDEFIQKLQEAGIGVSVHFIPLHTMPYYKKCYHLHDDDFPESLKTFKQTISLPIWQGMTEDQINRVIHVVKTTAKMYTK